MPLFGSSSPFDPDVEKITNEANTSEDWAKIMDLCDKINNTPNSSKDVLKAILKRLKHAVPHVVLQTITLLNACVNNCGKPFQQEISSSDFCTEARNIITKGHSKVAEKLKQHLQEWAEEYKNEASLSLLIQLYNSLKSEGYSFPTLESKSKSTTSSAPPSDPNIGSIDQESQDLAKAIELSLQAEKGKTSSLYPTVDAPVYATVGSTGGAKKEPRKVKALYDFEAVEDNELTFKAGEIISVLDDSDINWWKGENFRGIGLFPSNFVTADLTAETEPELKAREKKVTFDEEVEVKTIEAPEVVEINEELLDQCLLKLQNCDPTEERADTPDLLVSEDSANRMAPLIDTELEGIDRDLADYSALNRKLLDAFAMYHDLMKEAPVYGYSLQMGQSMPPSMYPGQGMGAAVPGAPMGHYQPPQQYHPQGGPAPVPMAGAPYTTAGIPGMVAVPPVQGPPPPQGPQSQVPQSQGQQPMHGPGIIDPAAMYSNSHTGSYGQPPLQSNHGAMVSSQTPLQYHSTYSDQQAPIPAPNPQTSYQGPPPNQGSPLHPSMYQAGGQLPPLQAPQQQPMM